MAESDEESFIHLPNDSISVSGSWKTMEEQTAWEIMKCQDVCRALEMDCLSLEKGRGECEQEASRHQEEAERLSTRLCEYEREVQTQELAFQKNLQLRIEETNQLLQGREALKKELEQLERLQIAQENRHKKKLEACLKMARMEEAENTPPSSSVDPVEVNLPERNVVFKGHVEEEKKEGTLPDTMTVQSRIRCPIPGGSALITFEDPKVARQIIAMRQHRVQLDEWTYVHVRAEPVTLLLPSSVEISVERSPRQILLSRLPILSLPDDRLLDKLELFFSKRQNKGGEVERVERLIGSDHVALTFMEDGVVERLVQRGQFQVPIGKETYEIKVSHYVSGEVRDLQFHPSDCAQTVLLSGIPDILGEELMREALEIHFQKPSKGGGEVEAIVYVPAGGSAAAIFEETEN